MYLDEGWKPRPEPEPRKPRMTDREELTLMWLVVVVALLLLIAPIGGGTIVQAVLAAIETG